MLAKKYNLGRFSISKVFFEDTPDDIPTHLK